LSDEKLRENEYVRYFEQFLNFVPTKNLFKTEQDNNLFVTFSAIKIYAEKYGIFCKVKFVNNLKQYIGTSSNKPPGHDLPNNPMGTA